MTSPRFRAPGWRLITITALAALAMSLFASSASAAVSAEPSTGLSKTAPTSVAVTGTEFKAGEKYRVGLCSKKTYGFMGIPACGTMIEVTANGSGSFSTSVTVEKTTVNVHASIPFPLNVGQPASFTCAGNPATNDECQIAVAEHGGTKTVLGGKVVTFLE
jgi:Neocarzinostatin family